MPSRKSVVAIPKYDASVTALKGVVEGGSSAGIVAAVAALVVEIMKAKNPEIAIGTAEVSLILGAVSGVLVGGFKALRNWLKNRNK
jgi:hypothetical protein